MTEEKILPRYDVERFSELGRRRRLQRLGVDPDKLVVVRVTEKPSTVFHQYDIVRAKMTA